MLFGVIVFQKYLKSCNGQCNGLMCMFKYWKSVIMVVRVALLFCEKKPAFNGFCYRLIVSLTVNSRS